MISPFGFQLASCRLCPVACGADRAGGVRGACGAGAHARVFRYGPHHGEEPVISGTCGSGTVFFSHCTMQCLYCQNHPWSQEGRGTDYELRGLTGIFSSLEALGCHNLNLVSPTPWWPQIHAALAESRARGACRLPVVCNTSGYERVRTLEAYAGQVDIFLADLRYAAAATAAEGSGRADYVEVAREALRWMWQARGPLQLDAAGLAQRGLVVRILALPGRAGEAVDSLHWLAAELGTDVAVSVMAQYVPAYRAGETPSWNRRVQPEEYAAVTEAVETLGFTQGWVQELEQDTDPELLGYAMQETLRQPAEAHML